MKKVYFTLIFVAILAMNGFSQNQLLNGGFEEGNDPDENWRPLNWPQVNSEGNAVWVGIVTPDAPEEVEACEGVNCFRIQAHTPGASGYIYQEIESPDGDDYELSFKANFSLGIKSELKIEVINKPEDGVDGPWSYLVLDSISINPDEWQDFTYAIEYYGDMTKESKLQFKFTVTVDNNDLDSKIFLDNIQFGVKGSLQSAVNDQLLNKNFIATNPVYDMLRFNNNLDEINEISIYSISGKKVFTAVSNNFESIDLSHLNKGIYLIEAKSENSLQSQRFIKK